MKTFRSTGPSQAPLRLRVVARASQNGPTEVASRGATLQRALFSAAAAAAILASPLSASAISGGKGSSGVFAPLDDMDLSGVLLWLATACASASPCQTAAPVIAYHRWRPHASTGNRTHLLTPQARAPSVQHGPCRAAVLLSLQSTGCDTAHDHEGRAGVQGRT